MALVYSRVSVKEKGGYTITDITLDGSYSAGGYVLDNAALGVRTVEFADAIYKHSSSTTQLVPTWNATTGKLQVYKGNGAAALTECAAGDITASHVVRLICFGTEV